MKYLNFTIIIAFRNQKNPQLDTKIIKIGQETPEIYHFLEKVKNCVT